MRSSPAVSEILSALAIIGVSVTVGATLFYVYGGDIQDAEDVYEGRLAIEKKRAAELIAIQRVDSYPDRMRFLLSNYAENHDMDINDFEAYVRDGAGEVSQGDINNFRIYEFTEPPVRTESLKSRSTYVAWYDGISCADQEELILVTPGQEIISIESKAECLPCPPDTIPSIDGCDEIAYDPLLCEKIVERMVVDACAQVGLIRL